MDSPFQASRPIGEWVSENPIVCGLWLLASGLWPWTWRLRRQHRTKVPRIGWKYVRLRRDLRGRGDPRRPSHVRSGKRGGKPVADPRRTRLRRNAQASDEARVRWLAVHLRHGRDRE